MWLDKINPLYPWRNKPAAPLALLLVVMMTAGYLWSDNRPTAWTEQELQVIQSLSLAVLPARTDQSNRYADNEDAIALGTRLFFDRRLSKNGTVSCAGCHKPDNYFSDQRIVAMGQDIGRRNTPSLLGVAYNNWFLWDGRKDSLWSQALSPLENPAEHDFSRTALVRLILGDQGYLKAYSDIFGSTADIAADSLPTDAHPSGTIAQIKAWKALPITQREQINRVFANTGKALAAYVTTLKPLAGRFDEYIHTQQNDHRNSQILSNTELRGLRLFISKKSGCINCHSGPLFSNQSFHNIGSGGQGDSGRGAALSRVKLDPFNCLGKFSDAQPEQCQELRFMQTNRHQVWGSFKTPGLRNVSNTAPYFHDGRYATLTDVLDHYTNTTAGDTHLPEINLSVQDKQDIIAFLKTLAADGSRHSVLDKK